MRCRYVAPKAEFDGESRSRLALTRRHATHYLGVRGNEPGADYWMRSALMRSGMDDRAR